MVMVQSMRWYLPTKTTKRIVILEASYRMIPHLFRLREMVVPLFNILYVCMLLAQFSI